MDIYNSCQPLVALGGELCFGDFIRFVFTLNIYFIFCLCVCVSVCVNAASCVQVPSELERIRSPGAGVLGTELRIFSVLCLVELI